VEQVPARRQPPHRFAAPNVLQAHRAQRAAPGLAAALGVGGAALVRERRRHVARRRAVDEPAGAPGRRRVEAPAGTSQPIAPKSSTAVPATTPALRTPAVAATTQKRSSDTQATTTP